MNADDESIILNRFETLRHPCDLDLLIFFARHPSTLIASEQLAAFLGYDIKQLALSLDVLIEAGLVTRSQPRTQVARLYMFAAGDSHGNWLPPLIALASTRGGRLRLMRVLKHRPPRRNVSASRLSPAASVPRPTLVRSRPDRTAPARPAGRRRGGA